MAEREIAVGGMDSVTTLFEGASGTIGMEVGNLHPRVQGLGRPGITYFQPELSATASALAEGFHTVVDCNDRCDLLAYAALLTHVIASGVILADEKLL